MKNKIYSFHAIILFAFAFQAAAIQGLKVTLQPPNVVLSWPSVEGATYIIRCRSTLTPSTPWVMLTNSLPAQTGTNLTFFICSNVAPCLQINTNTSSTTNLPPTPDPPASGKAASFDSIAITDVIPPELLAMPANGSGPAVPLMLFAPGFHFSGFVIFNPLTGKWLNGSGDSIPTPVYNGQSFDEDLSTDGGNRSGGGGGDPGFYEVVQVGATLYGLTNGMTIGGVMKLPVEVGEPSGQLTTVTLEDSGVPIATSVHVAPFELPVPLVILDTTQMSNGVHSISVYAQVTDPGDGTEDGSVINYEAWSPAVSVTVYNEVSFPNWMPQFGEGGNSLLINAQSAHLNAYWYVDVTNSQSKYIGTLGNSGGTGPGLTTNGNIYVVWNLIGPQGTLLTDNSFTFGVRTSYGAGVAPKSYRITDPWNGPGDWVVVNQQAWNTWIGHDELDIETDGFVTIAQGLGLTARPVTGTGSAYRLHFGANDPNSASDWTNFRSALYNNLSRNLFYLGHGSPDGLGYNQSTNTRSILETEIAGYLNWGRTNQHKYRFVCLDGCSTAPGRLPEAFGIIHKENVASSDYANGSVRPAAFAGWDIDVGVGFMGSAIITDHVYFFASSAESVGESGLG